MTALNELILAFDDAVRRAGEAASNDQDAASNAGPGFQEPQPVRDDRGPLRDVAEAEARVLEYRVKNSAELLMKTDFILREMRKITDESEEFDAYADQLRADIAAIAGSRAQ